MPDIRADRASDVQEGGDIERQERFETMYRQHEQRVLGYALRRAPVEAAQDAVADAFLVAWRRFDELPADPLPWLIETTRRTLANHRRSSGRQTLLAERLAHEHRDRTGLGGSTDDREHGAALAALARLSVDDRETLALVAWDELTPTQAARSLGCTAAAYRVRLHRARRRFATALGEAEAPGSSWSVPRPPIAEELPR